MRCRYHPCAEMRLIDSAVPHFGTTINERMKKIMKTGRKIWRCPVELCPWVEAEYTESFVTESQRGRGHKERYEEGKDGLVTPIRRGRWKNHQRKVAA